MTLLLEVDAYRQLQERAEEHASAHGVSRTDMVWGELVSRHIAQSLEEAYLTFPAGETPLPLGVNLTMIVVSLSTPAANQLRDLAREAARRRGVKGDVLEEFEWHHVGRTVELAYQARSQAASIPAAPSPLVDADGEGELFAG